MNHFSKKEAVKFGWDKLKKNIRFFIVVVIIIAALSWLPEYISSRIPKDMVVLSLVVRLASVVVSSLVTVGFIKSILNVVDGKKLKYSDLYENYRYIINYLLTETLGGLIVIAGFVLFIIPGIILSVKLQFTTYLVVDKGFGPIQAIKESWRLTKNIKWELFLFGLLLIAVNILGLLALGVGIIISYPLTLIAQAYVYRRLSERQPSSKSKKITKVVEK